MALCVAWLMLLVHINDSCLVMLFTHNMGVIVVARLYRKSPPAPNVPYLPYLSASWIGLKSCKVANECSASYRIWASFQKNCSVLFDVFFIIKFSPSLRYIVLPVPTRTFLLHVGCPAKARL